MKVVVLMGGISSEREISIASGEAVIRALKRCGYEVVGVDVRGEEFLEIVRQIKPDVVFIALHGRFGEDGTVQRMLEEMELPYTGSPPDASSLALDKAEAKKVFANCGVPTPPWVTINREEDPFEAVGGLGYPLIVKPAREGSTIGVRKVEDEKYLAEAVNFARGYDEKVIVEEFVEGRELTVGILGDSALPVVEILPKAGFYDFHTKYTKGEAEYIVPAPIDEELSGQAQELALRAHRALGCCGATRVDMRLDEDGNLWVLEVNTIPGMTETSLLPKAAGALGIGFDELCNRILELAVARTHHATS